jgi:hypothetical protein
MFIRTIATQPDSTHPLAPYNNDRYWPDNPPSEPTMCKDCGEVDVEEEGDLCAACYTDMILHMND